MEEILDIVGPPWFFGFMSAAEAKDMLQNQPFGSYLFRFSSNPGCYALSIQYGQVGHWRITTEKVGTSYPTFQIDGRTYKSMYEIIDVHQVAAEPLTIRASNNIKHCFLKQPMDKNIAKKREGVYEEMY
jgi:hypothetical protein